MTSRNLTLLAAMVLATVWCSPWSAEAKGRKWAFSSGHFHTLQQLRGKIRNQQISNHSRFTRQRDKKLNKPSHPAVNRPKSTSQPTSTSQEPQTYRPTTSASLRGDNRVLGGRGSNRIPRNLMRSFSPGVQEVLHYLWRTGRTGPATFDGDGTLWAGDVGLGFFEWMLRNGHYPSSRQPMLESAWRRYRNGQYNGERFYELMVVSMAGMKESTVKQLAGDYFRREHRSRIYRPMVNMVAALDRIGIQPWVVSGSPFWVVAAGARYLGIPSDRVIGLSVKVDEKGRLTDELVLPVPWKTGKAKRIMMDVGEIPVFAAGNSRGDIQMLRIASEPPLVINPCPSTLRAAQDNGWTVHRYNSSHEVSLRGESLLREIRPTETSTTSLRAFGAP